MNNSCVKRWLWFLVLYLGGIITIGLIATLIKWALS